jgi:hypothetical protein
MGRLVYAARQSTKDLAIFDYRGVLGQTGAATVGLLDPSATTAATTLRQALAGLGQAQAIAAARAG